MQGCSGTLAGQQTLLTIRRHPVQIPAPCNKRRCVAVQAEEQQRRRTKAPAQEEGGEGGLGLKAVWVGAEKFGDLVGLAKPKPPNTAGRSSSQGKITREEAIEGIKRDYDETYFFTGRGDMEVYEDDCLFADPFTGFKGVQRFKKNVSNLGGLLQDIKLDITDWQEGPNELKTRWRISGVVQLPWRPILAAAGGTTHVFSSRMVRANCVSAMGTAYVLPQLQLPCDGARSVCLDTGRVVKHLEEWDVEVSRVLQRLMRPGPGMTAKTIWLQFERPLLLAAAPVVAASLACLAATGQGLPGAFLGGLEGLAYLALVAGVITEALKSVGQR